MDIVYQNNITDIGALEALILENDLDRLEALTSGFNIFESIGAVRREVRHSDFLSFLLNPTESHGLLDAFLKSILFGISKRNRATTTFSPIDIDLLDLSSIEVRREWENIDILLLSEREKFVCAIENKIDSSEHSNQLSRYEAQINSDYSDYTKLFVLLTLDGEPPEKDQNWLPYSYKEIYEVTTSILNEYEGKIGEDIYTLLRHYSDMVNRHLMNDNEIAELSKKIYQKHKKALDIIFEHKPDILTETNKWILDVIKMCSAKKVVIDHCTKSYVRFSLERWDEIDGQKTGDGQWTNSNRVLLFEIVNSLTEITLRLLIGPGKKEFREDLFGMATDEPKIFKGKSKSLAGKWTQIFKCKIVTKEQMEYDLESIENLIRQELNNFFYHGSFQKIIDHLDKIYNIEQKEE